MDLPYVQFPGHFNLLLSSHSMNHWITNAWPNTYWNKVVVLVLWTDDSDNQGRHFVLFWGCICTPNVKFCNPNDDFAPSRARNLGKHRQEMSPICDNCMASLRLFGKFWKKYPKLRKHQGLV